jgi:methylmalonyl-CoA/ethylmalonyl-CoA epimerase
MLKDFKFHHIGIATASIARTSKYYVEVGYTMTDPVVDTIQDIRISFLRKDGMPAVELLEPVDEKSPVNTILKQMGGTAPYHCCYVVQDINKAINDLKHQKFIQLSKPQPAVAIDNHPVCFLYNKDVGLIELVEIPIA